MNLAMIRVTCVMLTRLDREEGPLSHSDAKNLSTMRWIISGRKFLRTTGGWTLPEGAICVIWRISRRNQKSHFTI